MKKLFFLFAASALLVACSSDDQADLQGGNPVTEPTEATVSVATVDYENGVQIAVGDLDGDGTRAAEVTEPNGSVNFVIDLTKYNDVLEAFSEYKLKADDFAVRRDGVYDGTIVPTDNKYQYWTIEMVEENLKVAVKNLEKLTFEDCKDYTFEFYLWIENKKLLNDGTGGYGELFTDDDKSWWITKQIGNWPVAEGEETGMDISEDIWNANGGDGKNFFENYEEATPAGLLVRYNVYRGLQGLNGDTPYIKVSVHVEKKDQTTEQSKENECTWVHIPYEAK